MNWMSLPYGRKLEEPDVEPGHVGTLSRFRRADAASLGQMRKRLSEVRIDDEQQGRYLTDRSGREWEVVTSFFDPVEPGSVGAEAFCIRDSRIVPLRPVGWKAEGESRFLGEVGGREAGPREPMPVSGIR